MRQVILILTALLTATVAAATESQARDKALLNKALATSTEERSGVASQFKAGEASARRLEKDGSLRAISLEIGDELGTGGVQKSESQDFRFEDRSYRERGVAKKLDREWREVNRGFKKPDQLDSNRGGRRF